MTRLFQVVFIIILSLCTLVSFGQDVAATSTDNIVRGARFDDLKLLQKYEAQGGDLNLREKDRGENLLMLSVREDSNQVFAYLIAHPHVQIDQRANNGDTALMLAAYLEKVSKLKALIAAGAKPNQSGWTALHYACVVGNLEIVKILLSHQADVNAETPNKTTSLMLAARRGELQIVKKLLEHGAELGQKNMLGWSAIDFAVEAERRDIAAFLKQQIELSRKTDTINP